VLLSVDERRDARYFIDTSGLAVGKSRYWSSTLEYDGFWKLESGKVDSLLGLNLLGLALFLLGGEVFPFI
jgi:hypothetical protein